jgi:hypothetical protein
VAINKHPIEDYDLGFLFRMCGAKFSKGQRQRLKTRTAVRISNFSISNKRIYIALITNEING